MGELVLAAVAVVVLALLLVPKRLRGRWPSLLRWAGASFLLTMAGLACLREQFLIGVGLVVLAWYVSDWRPRKAGAASAPPASATALTVAEAYAVLGLNEGASETEIRDAHRVLIQKVHPDHGGTSYLAAKLNQARDLLLSRRR